MTVVQKHPFTQVFTCHACNYDMHDRAKGDLCPECGTPLDTRKDDPVAEHKSRVGLGNVILSVILLPVIGFFSLFFLGVALHYYIQHHYSSPATYRVSYTTRKRRRVVKRLCWVWLFEFGVLMGVSRLWPNLFSWL